MSASTKKILVLLILSLITLSFTACTQPRTATIRLNREQERCYAITSLTHQLAHQGVQAYQIGETIDVVVPTDLIYNANSANFRPAAYPILHNLAHFLNYYQAIDVKVVGYNDRSNVYHFSKALTHLQAQKLSSFLWDHCLDARFVTVQGKNGNCNVANNQVPAGRALNRRIEISFRYVSPVPDYNQWCFFRQ